MIKLQRELADSNNGKVVKYLLTWKRQSLKIYYIILSVLFYIKYEFPDLI